MRLATRFGAITLTSILLLLATVAEARSATITVAGSGGGLYAKGASEGSPVALGSGAVTVTWPVARGLELGFRQTVGFATVPYGNNDGEAIPFGRSGYCLSCFDEESTWIPSTTVVLRYAPISWLAIDSSIGYAFFLADSGRSLPPFPLPAFAAGLEVEVVHLPSVAIRLRAHLDGVTTGPWDKSPLLFLMPQAGVVLAF
jgi:hypothetical protein